MSEGESPEPLEELDARMRKARRDGQPAPGENGAGAPSSGFGAALRIGIELVAALGVGVGIGLLLDHWLGTAPWFLIAFFFLGAAAGILNVYRAASGFGLAVGYKTPEKEENRNGTG